MSTYSNRRPSYGQRRRKRSRKTPMFRKGMRITLFAFFVLFIIAFIALLVKIYYINDKNGDRYKKNALSQQTYTNTVLNFQRGAIKDRNNTTLAMSIRRYNLVLEPKTLMTSEEKKIATINAMATYFGVDRDDMEIIITENPKSMYYHIDSLKGLSTETVEGFKKLMDEDEKIQGIWFEETYERNYPLKTIASNLVGFLSSDEQGTYGIEEAYNDVLNGTTGREYGYFDSNMDLQRTIKEAEDGNSVILTIDANVQKIIEEEIQNFQKNEMGAERIAVMVMNPKNGEILAMASDSSFDLNDPQNLSYMYTEEEIAAMTEEEKGQNLLRMWGNFCISSSYEPGSTYKPFTIAASMDENVADSQSLYNCTGYRQVADAKIRCSNRSGHGMIDLQKSLMESCNCALMDMAEQLGRNKFSKYNKLYGFGQRTGVDLPGETSGLIHTKDELNPVELATSSFGQTQTVTMVQMLSGFCSLINGGNYYQPHIVKEIQNSDGDVVESIEPVIVKKTTTEETSEKMRQYLKATVEEGTALPAKIKGYSIGGKTGTAEKHEEDEGNYLVSFIGCVPVENPEVAFYVIIDEPHTEDQAHSTYATEFSSKLMKKVLPFLGQYASK